MSSNRRPDRSRLSGWLRGWSLRARLTAIIVALLAVVCLVVGVGTSVALRGFLLAQVDSQLGDVSGRAVRDVAGPPTSQPRTDGKGLVSFGQPPGTLVAHLRGGAVNEANVLVNHGVLPVDPTAYRMLREVPAGRGTPAVSRDLGGDLGSYRLQAHPVPNGDVIVTGLPLRQMDQTLVRLALVELVIAVAVLLIGGTAGGFIVRHTLRPLRRVAATASRVSELPLDRGEVALSVRVPGSDSDPGTEVGQVGAAINRMLGHVSAALNARHASEQRVRQFVADASHELRTPLAAIRGYAELTRRGRYELPADVTHALSRVESESARMTTLVEDLLLLARLDSGRPLARDEVDLTRMVADAVSDAHVAGPEHAWRLDLPAEPVTVTGDGARLHQVLANVLGNARAHTPPGTTVTTGLRGDERHVELRVVDDGPGIPAELLPDVFDRFARGDSSRSRAAGSTGLGLAIVAAVVAAHDGTVRVRSLPGHTSVTVDLPR